MSTETFGAMLKRIRTSAPPATYLSQNALAKRVGVNQSYINRLERDTRTPSRPVVLGIADALGLDRDTTDRLLFAAGLAPQTDWQTLLESYLSQALDVFKRRATGQEAVA